MGLINALIQAWPIFVVMGFLIWARIYATKIGVDPPRGPVMLILILVLFLNLNRVQVNPLLYLLCLPLAAQIAWQLLYRPEDLKNE